MFYLKALNIILKAVLFFTVVTGSDIKRANAWGGIPKNVLGSIKQKEKIGLCLLAATFVLDIYLLSLES